MSQNSEKKSRHQKGACLVTGAGRRLGRSIALAMAQAGWDVAIHFRSSAADAAALAQDISRLGQRAISLKASLDQEAEVRQLFRQAEAALGPLGCVVNNASRFEFDRPESFCADDISRHMQSNLVAPLLLTQLLYEARKPSYKKGADPSGVVIHLLDQKLANPNPDFFSYTLSKAALAEATRLCAMAMAPVLRVVAIAPGITLPSADQTPAEFKTSHQMTPLGASSRPDEVADAVVWLAQARAVCGTTLLVDGGQHLLAQPRDVMMMIR